MSNAWTDLQKQGLRMATSRGTAKKNSTSHIFDPIVVDDEEVRAVGDKYSRHDAKFIDLSIKFAARDDPLRKIDSIDDDDSSTTRAWLGRHVWSFFYTIELPNRFLRNECFCLAPNIKIDTSMDMPYLSSARFLKLRPEAIQRHINFLLTNGFPSSRHDGEVEKEKR